MVVKRKGIPFWGMVLEGAPDDCWPWLGYLNKSKYGQYGSALAHRISFETRRGLIPQGLVIDHLCRNTLCVNPSHLEPVSHVENMRRGLKGSLTTHCPKGHAYDSVNTRLWHGRRICRICNNEASRMWRAQRKAVHFL